jgi:hypothetical protein
MRDSIVIAQFERRLVELGCPSRRMREKVGELAEHYEDLKQAAIEDGLPEKEAEARASAQLGDPMSLAENTVMLLRQSSWWGRHPFIGFCLLPPLCFVPAWFGCGGIFLGVALLLGRILPRACVFDESATNALYDDPTLFKTFLAPLSAGLTLAAILSIVTAACWLARRSALGLKWIVAACAAIAINMLFENTCIRPRAVFIGYWWHSQYWFFVVIPLLAAGGIYLYQRRIESHLAWVPMEPDWETARRIRNNVRTPFHRTPTCWVVVILTAVALNVGVGSLTAWSIERAQKAELKTKVWPAERAATLALLKSRQSSATATVGETINLSGFLNATLTDCTDGPAFGGTNKVPGNNLAGLPMGMNSFGGVLFDVEGKIQLAGSLLPPDKRKFPGHVNNIPIARRCTRIHLLHGVTYVSAKSWKVARLVLHYEDGSKSDIDIALAKDVLNWWGPIYNTESGDGRNTTSPETELAWVGSNPAIEKLAPHLSLRLYLSTFANPHPDLEISSIDYVSTLSGIAPFLVGLSVYPPTPQTEHPAAAE